jgi:hypothetical protein
VVERPFTALQEERILSVTVEVLALDPTSVKVRPDGNGAPERGEPIHRKIEGGVNTKIHMVSVDDRTIAEVLLSAGSVHDPPEGVSIAVLSGQAETPF